MWSEKLAVVESHSKRVSSYVFKRKYTGEEVPIFNAKINHVIDNECNWNNGDILYEYSELENVLNCEASHAVSINCFGPQKSAFISNLIDRKLKGIIQLGRPKLAKLSTFALSYMLTNHNKCKYACAFESAYSLAQRLHFQILSLQYENCAPQPGCH